jgi:hypothetical protein
LISRRRNSSAFSGALRYLVCGAPAQRRLGGQVSDARPRTSPSRALVVRRSPEFPGGRAVRNEKRPARGPGKPGRARIKQSRADCAVRSSPAARACRP